MLLALKLNFLGLALYHAVSLQTPLKSWSLQNSCCTCCKAAGCRICLRCYVQVPAFSHVSDAAFQDGCVLSRALVGTMSVKPGCKDLWMGCEEPAVMDN